MSSWPCMVALSIPFISASEKNHNLNARTDFSERSQYANSVRHWHLGIEASAWQINTIPVHLKRAKSLAKLKKVFLCFAASLIWSFHSETSYFLAVEKQSICLYRQHNSNGTSKNTFEKMLKKNKKNNNNLEVYIFPKETKVFCVAYVAISFMLFCMFLVSCYYLYFTT